MFLTKQLNKAWKKYKKIFFFLLGGGLGALINWIITFILTSIIGIYYLISYSFALIINILFNFFWNRNITFKVKSKFRKRLLRFILTSLFSLVISMSVMYLIKEYVLDRLYNIVFFGYDLNYLVAIIIVTFLVSLLNYILSNFWVFKK